MPMPIPLAPYSSAISRRPKPPSAGTEWNIRPSPTKSRNVIRALESVRIQNDTG